MSDTRALFDTLIPPSADGSLPGAGSAGVGEEIERALPELHGLVLRVLEALDAQARAQGAASFAALDGAARQQALRAYDAAHPGFVPGIVFQVYTRYYQDARVVAALGIPPRPPHPEGYPLEQPDLDTLLAPVRSGPTRYRAP